MLLPRASIASLALGCALPFALVAKGPAQPENPRVEAIRFWSFGDVTRIAVDTQGEYKFSSEAIGSPAPRLYFDLKGLRPPATYRKTMQTIPVGDRRVKQIRVAEVAPGVTRVVFDLETPVEAVASQLVNPDRLMIELRPQGTALPALTLMRSVTGSQRVNLDAPLVETAGDLTKPPLRKADLTVPMLAPPLPVTTAPQPTLMASANIPSRDVPPAVRSSKPDISAAKRGSLSDPSLVRVFGLKLGRVVIDAGHGGKDTGTIGPNGLLEKELVLDVALRLGALIRRQLGADVVYTRSDDTFIPLEERTRIANREKADLFISVHANSSPDATATGVETYYFNLHGGKKELDLAMRENATAASSISDLNDLLHKAVLQTKLEESREFAQKIQDSLCAASIQMNNRAHDRGVRRAPFVVLIGATMPSILAEIGFVSNPHDEKQLRRNEQRDKIAAALLKGVVDYADTLSHSQMASAGQ